LADAISKAAVVATSHDSSKWMGLVT